ncbi:hypothetical protein AB0G74_14280 [Streptomyces sp. NPDC020875]|uniref:hypothetical protein n=1 Tax=Streptomyces sp. NPDC020875 TaxID=3154898 RepID=UPI0034111C3E
MLTMSRMPRLELRLVFWCRAIAYTPCTNRTFRLGSHPAATPRLAVRWLHMRADHIAEQLDLQAATAVRHWLTNRAEQENALSLLARGEPYSRAIQDDGIRYLLSAFPISRTARRQQAP